MELPYLDRAADPSKGSGVYQAKCASCHGRDGQGQANIEEYGYAYPPLWGPNSYNTGAGLYRISRFAGFVKNSMPFGQADYHNPALTNEEAWDVAAFVNAHTRPVKDLSLDWPDISKKPIDHPFGPYADEFSEEQHKYGPFKPIQEARKEKAARK
jgi:thiosulfate dehydrogenase